MPKVARLAVAVAVLTMPAAALAATAGSRQPRAINCGQEQLKPRRIVLACGDGAIWLGKLAWSSWTTSKATAAGSYNAIDCTPDCAAGHVKRYPVKITLTVPKRCPGTTHPAFRRAALSFTGTRPKGVPVKLSFRCPPALPQGY